MQGDRRLLGLTGLQVHPLCLGANAFGWTVDEEGSFAVLDAYAAGGGNFIDTADVYAAWPPVDRPGVSEEIIGRWIAARGNREEMVVATKLGAAMSPTERGLSARYVREAAEASLRRLGVEHIDLLYAHYDDPHTPIEETMAALDGLVREGKVRAIGASNFTAARLEEALAASDAGGHAAYAALQPELNLLDRGDMDEAKADLCRERGLAVMPYYALANGFLTGKYRQGEPLPPTQRAEEIEELYLGEDDAERSWRVLAVLEEVAAELERPPAQVVIAWLSDHPLVTAPIASATAPEQVDTLLEAVSVELPPDARARLDAVGGK